MDLRELGVRILESIVAFSLLFGEYQLSLQN